MNTFDSDSVEKILSDMGYTKAKHPDFADVLFVNTCSVRQNAENRAFAYISSNKSWRKAKKGRSLIVAGCYPERAGEELKKRCPHVDLFIGAKESVEYGRKIKDLLNPKFEDDDYLKNTPYSNFVTIMRGCDNYCSYCIVPYVRGHEESIPIDEIEENIRQLIDAGKRKLTLLGQNVNSYGSFSEKRSKNFNFVELLEYLTKVDGIESLTFLTNHPKDMSRELVDLVVENDKIEKIIHLPLQSGSNRILELMNRRYTREDFLNIVEYIRSRKVGIKISSDIITGFPTETEKDHQDTLDVIRKSGFNIIFAFKYSPRSGTSSFSLKDDVPLSVKERRLSEILDLQKVART